MKRSTKRVVGWGTGVAIGVVLILLTSVLVIVLSGAPTKSGIESDGALKMDMVETEEH